MATNRLLIITHSSSCWMIQPEPKNDLSFRRGVLKTKVIINRDNYYASVGLLDDDVLDIDLPPTPVSNPDVRLPDSKKINIMASEIEKILTTNEIPDVDINIIVESIVSLRAERSQQ